MSRLVDKLQEMTAPPPPLAMRTAYRQQEQRRQKLFVGEYSMRPDAHGRSKEGTITMMGTNPFKRTTRVQGVASGGWGDRTADISGTGAKDYLVNRNFPQTCSGVRSIQFRNKLSESIYGLAQHIQTEIVRSKFQSQVFSNCGTQSEDLIDSSLPTFNPDDYGGGSVVLWGTANDISNIVIEYLDNEKAAQLADITATDTTQKVSAMTGLIRDMVDWIEQEDWERRIRYLFIVDVFLVNPKIEEKLLACSAFPLLSKTLSGPACLESPQRSVQVLSTQLSSQVKRAYNEVSRGRTAQTSGGGGGGKNSSPDISKMSLLDIGP
ncbi:hypothetical protein BGZ76_003675 [Entomortierella beljakovae]|nr:hypothetical protein BGZ76_003675 [Entomortierella beljakovae]